MNAQALLIFTMFILVAALTLQQSPFLSQIQLPAMFHSALPPSIDANEVKRSFIAPEILSVSSEVRDALSRGQAVVALESTIITHGMPFPQNYDTAIEVERIVRNNGAVPATIAILNGTIHVGLDNDKLKALALTGTSAIKTSRRDLSVVIAKKLTGSTTVSATSLLASIAGIRVFVTGGLGGVHRGAEESMDISADLIELGKTPIAVICAGVKSILDIGKTLEVLETHGVAVIGYGTDEFPSFFTRSSGFKVPHRIDSVSEAASMIEASTSLGLGSGMVIGVPIPREHEAQGKLIEDAIQRALRESEDTNIMGRDVTPFLLKRVNELTKGASLAANIELIKNNAKIGAQISHELSRRLQRGGEEEEEEFNDIGITMKTSDVVVIGGAVVDLVGYPAKETGLKLRTSNPGRIDVKLGGVGRNIAETLARLGAKPTLITSIGDDVYGRMILQNSKDVGIQIDSISHSASTAIYNGIIDEKGHLVVAVADMEVFKSITPQVIESKETILKSAKMIVVDGNLRHDTLAEISRIADLHDIPLFFEPTSVAKSKQAIKAGILNKLDFVSPNSDELIAMVEELGYKGQGSTEENVRALLLDGGVDCVIAKLGADGVLVGSKSGADAKFKRYPAPQVDEIVSVSGAGDSFVGCFVFGRIQGKSTHESIEYGLQCAKYSLMSEFTVHPSISRSLLAAGVQYAIIGLGNPGETYINTRHNIGFTCVDHLAQSLRWNFSVSTKTKSMIAEGSLEGKKIIIAKPMTFMNLSGDAVRSLTSYYKIPVSNILIIVDDMALPVGRISLRKKGGAGGQNGLEHIIQCLGTNVFSRLRVGISRPQTHVSFVDYVLAPFSRSEEPFMRDTVEKVRQCSIAWLEKGMDRSMNLFNVTPPIPLSPDKPSS